MQGVYLKKVVSSHQVEKLLNDYKGFVYFLDSQSRRYIRFMTKEQKLKLLQQTILRERMFGSLIVPQIEGVDTSERSLLKHKVITLEEVQEQFSLGSSIALFVRPGSKKELKLSVEKEPENVILEATSAFDNEFSGSLLEIPLGEYSVVGPEPSEKRTWFASVFWVDRKKRWTVK